MCCKSGSQTAKSRFPKDLVATRKRHNETRQEESIIASMTSSFWALIGGSISDVRSSGGLAHICYDGLPM